jgi:glycogen debranching enzyme
MSMSASGDESLALEGYERAIELLRDCATEDGFLASPENRANYRRVWARDGTIMGLAALLSGEKDLVACFRRTLETLARHQGPHGEIPSNVNESTGRISFGGTTGRVDADLWFVIGCTEFWLATGDDAFREELRPVLDRVRFLLGCWEFNNRGLLYVPQTGDWADEYVQAGYVLYDQLLYLQAQRSWSLLAETDRGPAHPRLEEKTERLLRTIRASFWIEPGDISFADVYHEVLHDKGVKVVDLRPCPYWLPFFSPTGYGYRFDALANILASLLGVADSGQVRHVDRKLDDLCPEALRLVPAFHPVIRPLDEDWTDLQMCFTYTFKNRPHEYHNGGLWPFITGFRVADLASRGHSDAAHESRLAVHRANRLPGNGEAWSFPEYVHGKELTAGGTRRMGWSAAAAVIAERTLEGARVFRVGAGGSSCS